MLLYLPLLLSVLHHALSQVQVTSRIAWGAADSTSALPRMSVITDIVIGNDVSTGALDCYDEAEKCYDWMKRIQTRDQQDMSDLKYNFYVSRDGFIFEGRGWDYQGEFSERYSLESLGVAYLGDYSNGLSVAAQNAVKELIKLGITEKKVIKSSDFCILFTCDLDKTMYKCPGGGIYYEINSWQIGSHKAKYNRRNCGCGTLENPQNGMVSVPSYSENMLATYSCNNGFELIGQNSRVCEKNGKWSDDSFNPSECVQPKNGLVIMSKGRWDSVVPNKEYINPGFPISTISVKILDVTCYDDDSCRKSLKAEKTKAINAGQPDVECNFYISSSGIVYEGRGWGVKGAYQDTNLDTTQGACLIGMTTGRSFSTNIQTVEKVFFMLVKDAQEKKRLTTSFCTTCPGDCDPRLNRRMNVWLDGDVPKSPIPDSLAYCAPSPVVEDNKAPAVECRRDDGVWSDYTGQVSTSASGCQCQEWGDQSPLSHPFYPEVYPHADLTNNFCRNPDNDPKGPWCVCGAGRESCKVPQCAVSVSFTSESNVRYTLFNTRSTTSDKMTFSITPAYNEMTAKLIRIDGEYGTYWEVSLYKGFLHFDISLFGSSLTLQTLLPVVSQETTKVQVKRRLNKLSVTVNNFVITVEDANITVSDKYSVKFLNPSVYTLGTSLADTNYTTFTGCIADLTFNKDNILNIITGGESLSHGDLSPNRLLSDDGCLALLPYEWAGVDVLTTMPPPTTVANITTPFNITEAATEAVITSNDSWAWIIIVIVLLIILVILLIACVLFKHHNKNKGVYKVDEAKTTKWSWKQGILPVLVDEKKGKNYEQVNHEPEVFA